MPLKIKNIVVTIKSRLYFIETTASTVDKKNPALHYFKQLPLQGWSHEYQHWCTLILSLFHGIIEVTEWSLQMDVHIMNAALGRHLYQSWKGNFLQQKIFIILQRCYPFLLVGLFLKSYILNLMQEKERVQHFCLDLHFLSFSIFSHR